VGGLQERLAAPPFTTQLSRGSSTKVVFRSEQLKIRFRVESGKPVLTPEKKILLKFSQQ
jgi:hypothetical protein